MDQPDIATPKVGDEERREPLLHRLANARYRVHVSDLGTGYAQFGDCLLNAWRNDRLEDYGGVTLYLRDLDRGSSWTASGRALPGQTDGTVACASDCIVIDRLCESIESRVTVRLPSAAGVELRECRFTNRGGQRRRIEITSYFDVALDNTAAFDSHPAFSKLFVQTAWDGSRQALIAARRPREPRDRWPFLVHTMVGATISDFTTDRARFIGRGRSVLRPIALTDRRPLGAAVGNMLDPAMSLRTVLELEPGDARTVTLVVAADHDREVALSLAFTPGVAAAIRPLAAGREPRPPEAAIEPRPPVAAGDAPEGLRFWNGYGGFQADGREYFIGVPAAGACRTGLPPAPWANVICNRDFGLLVSEKGAGTVWYGNSREWRLTPWRNDPVSDPHGDAFYVRDEDTGEFWSPMPGPAAPNTDVQVMHGFGYSRWRQQAGGLQQELTLFVPADDPLRVARLRIRNETPRARRLALYSYNRWVLGSTPEATAATILAEFSPSLQAVLARNPASHDGPGPIAFAAAQGAEVDGWTTNRENFLGRRGELAAPAALTERGRLRDGPPGDPCAALQLTVEVPPGSAIDISFLLGAAVTKEEIETLLDVYRQPGGVDLALKRCVHHWRQTLSGLQVETPSRAFDYLVNGWLPYQTIACRLWGRTAFYQSGGAYGFRDQLQDAAGMIQLRPGLLRDQILLHAAHQFVEGDVLHWWHPPDSRGLRTRFADDRLWLPWAVAYYTGATGDHGILNEEVRFLRARALRAGEDEAYLQPEVGSETGDIYDHCCRAIDCSLATGRHGLPLFGTGDWNDGMNRVGRGGRGESVWMGFFLYAVLDGFIPLCAQRGDSEHARRYEEHRNALHRALEAEGWDGAWYRRGWYDDGTPLGSNSNEECRIDALVQAWAVISGAAPAERANMALDAVERHLVDEDAGIIRLLTPPFVDAPGDPGYIKGYVAGVRENGGQYTHAALWVVRAMAEAGRRDRAMQLMEALNPVNHALTAAAAERYKVEPYVVAADVYGTAPHVGRGGWTWYTGSSGWMYRIAVETLLGLTMTGGETICLHPRIPDRWPGYRIRRRFDDGTRLDITVRNPDGCAARIVRATFDGRDLEIRDGSLYMPLPRTGREHRVDVLLGRGL